MKGESRVETMLDDAYKTAFHKRCLDYGTNMSDVLKKKIQEWMDSHPPIGEKIRGGVI
jgi:Zn-dependent protease with chaperone function